MGLTVDPVETDAALPEQSDVVVIGGGIAGVCTALFLAEKNISVTLCEKGHIAGEQSSRNWGWCRQMGRDKAEIPLSVEALRLWAGMNDRVEGETGFRRAGIIYTCDAPSDLAEHEEWIEHARLYQIDTRVLTAEEMERLMPGAARKFAGAVYTASDGRAEPQKAASAIAAATIRKGATVLTNCAVRGIETTGGRISGVVTERGPIRCNSVVLAAGAWSRLFCGNHGLELPQLKVLGSVFRTEKLDGPPEVAVGGSDFAFRKRLDGGYTISRRGATAAPIVPDSFRLLADFLPSLWSQRKELRLRLGSRFVEEWRLPRRWALDAVSPFERVRVLDPEPLEGTLTEARENLVKAFPAFAPMKVAQSWAGLIDVTPDAVPVIAPVAAIPGFFMATGFSGHGFGIGPGAGRLMADLVAGDTPIVDPAPFRYERFRRTAVQKVAA
ncbi:MAG TPA: FAD-binding oxidoreductase [Acetobacteraceae bacterium]|jgi:glycine/D-amino acid oxidase-like deaminating enzyme|nr:FAD-binding oxidoreductase [Acetobacteraceae bacterium]